MQPRQYFSTFTNPFHHVLIHHEKTGPATSSKLHLSF